MMAQTKVQREFVLTVTDEELLVLEECVRGYRESRKPGLRGELHEQLRLLYDKAGLKAL